MRERQKQTNNLFSKEYAILEGNICYKNKADWDCEKGHNFKMKLNLK